MVRSPRNPQTLRGLAIALLLFCCGCNGPLAGIPGGALTGPEQPLSALPPLTEDGILTLETRPVDPYSVNIGFRAIDGQIYIDPSKDRTWYKNLQAEPRVRIRLDRTEVIYTATAEVVTDSAITREFDSDRVVMRLQSRN